jgi:hypothetical protein
MHTLFDREAERSATLAELSKVAPPRRTELIEEYRRRSEEAYAPETLRNYRQITASFRAWCSDNGHSSDPPIAPEVVADYCPSSGFFGLRGPFCNGGSGSVSV